MNDYINIIFVSHKVLGNKMLNADILSNYGSKLQNHNNIKKSVKKNDFSQYPTLIQIHPLELRGA